MKITLEGSICLFFLVAGLCACSSKKELKYLINEDTVYYYKTTDKPFSGKIYSIDTSLGKVFISSFYTFNRGVPEGNWKAFDYEGNTIQEGFFSSFSEVKDLSLQYKGIRRININRFKEADSSMIDIYVISNRLTSDSIQFEGRKRQLVDYLIHKNYLKKDDIARLQSIIISDGEF